MNGHVEVVEGLLSFGAEPDIKDKLYGYTPLMLAARQGHAGVMKILLKHSCNVNEMDIHGENALFDSVRNGHTVCVELLLNHGANVNHIDSEGRTVLLAAVLWNRLNIVKMLVKRNCIMDKAGSTQYVHSVLMQSSGNSQMAKTFTPIEAALISGKADICEILYTAGAKTGSLYKYIQSDTLQEYIKAVTGNEGITKVINWLKCKLIDPRSLKEHCRITVRNCCREQFHQRINEINLPEILIEYLKLSEIEV